MVIEAEHVSSVYLSACREITINGILPIDNNAVPVILVMLYDDYLSLDLFVLFCDPCAKDGRQLSLAGTSCCSCCQDRLTALLQQSSGALCTLLTGARLGWGNFVQTEENLVQLLLTQMNVSQIFLF